jgi:ubiquinone/menaquinone biosynthesis C-methylase UbiE
VGAALWLSRQCRRPSGRLGRRVARVMNTTHRPLTEWGLSHVTIEPRFTLLDIGCGGGGTVATLANAAGEGKVYGVDISPASVSTARRTNAQLIDSGRVEVRLASVAALPFGDDTFDLATAVETFYYWPDPVASLREILRVLRPRGTLIIIAETYRGRRMDWLYRPVMRLLFRATYLTPGEHQDLLRAAGFTEVEAFTEVSNGWLCVAGRKPIKRSHDCG